MKSTTPYSQMIRESLAAQGLLGHDVRHVEAFLRLEHGTLDALSPAAFAREVAAAAACVDEAGPALSEDLATSHGL